MLSSAYSKARFAGALTCGEWWDLHCSLEWRSERTAGLAPFLPSSGQASRGANRPNPFGGVAEFKEDEFEHTETFARWIEEREAEGDVLAEEAFGGGWSGGSGVHAFGAFAN